MSPPRKVFHPPVALAVPLLLAAACAESDSPDYVLEAAVAPDDPPENEELDLLVNIQAGVFDGENGAKALVEVLSYGGELTLAGGESSTRGCLTVPADLDAVGGAVVHRVQVAPTGRSARLIALLWDGGGADAGCPDDFSGRSLIATAAIVVPPDEEEPDGATSTAGESSDSSTGPSGSSSGSNTDTTSESAGTTGQAGTSSSGPGSDSGDTGRATGGTQ